MKPKTKIPPVVKQVDSSHYFLEGAESKGQFCSYWHQINEIMAFRVAPVLEIGIGRGFISDYLKKRQSIPMINLDIDPELAPDSVGSVLAIPFRKETFAVIACFEVLEHLPYSFFVPALKEMYRVTSKYVIISLPHNIHRSYRVLLDLPRLKLVEKMIWFSNPNKYPLPHDTHHHWEIDIKGYPLKRIESDIASAGFKIARSYRVFEKPYHHFFIFIKVPF